VNDFEFERIQILLGNGSEIPYGLYQRGTAHLFVTRGIGTLTIPARFLCAPEMAILSLNA